MKISRILSIFLITLIGAIASFIRVQSLYSDNVVPMDTMSVNSGYIELYKCSDINYNAFKFKDYISEKSILKHINSYEKKYVDELNTIIIKYPELQNIPLDKLLMNLNKVPKNVRSTVKNYAGGIYNHRMYFSIIGVNSYNKDTIATKSYSNKVYSQNTQSKEKMVLGKPQGRLLNKINSTFGSFDKFKEQFQYEAEEKFSSGWVWLVKDRDGNLKIMNTVNEDCPVMAGLQPILALDLWEHSYYDYCSNGVKEYLNVWWNLINWDVVEQYYE